MPKLSCALIFCLFALWNAAIVAQGDSGVAVAEPNDSIMASRAECQEMLGWAGAVFADAKGPDLKSPLVTPAVPFSFRYGVADSASLLPTWKRTVELKDRDMGDRVQHRVFWDDPKTGLRVTAVASAFKQYPAVEWVLYFENRGKNDTPILENIQAMDAMLCPRTSQPAVLHRIFGDSCSETSFLPADTTLVATQKIFLAPTGGRSSRLVFPFFNLECAGDGLIVAIGWSGQWAASIEQANDGPVRVVAGMEKTHLVLHPGEQIRTPRILLMPWKGDYLASQQRFRRLLMFHYLPKQNGRLPAMPIALEAYERYYRRNMPALCSEKGQLGVLKLAHEMGCDAYWLDAGWYTGDFKPGEDTTNWIPLASAFPRGLKPLGDECHRLGMKFVLWFHPEFDNIGDPAVWRAMTDRLSQRISQFGVDIYRNDFNMEPVVAWRAADTPKRQGMAEIRAIEGLYAMWDELRQRHPTLLVDNCASGGNRLDLETCMRSVPLWRSDVGCSAGHDDWYQSETQGLSLFLPVFGTAAWATDAYSMRSAAAAGVACMFDVPTMNFSTAEAKAALAEVRENQKYWYGDYYPLTRAVAGKDQWAAYQFHRSDLNAGLVLAFRRSDCPCPSLLVTLNAIEPTADYTVEFIDGARKTMKKTMSGRELSTEMELKLPKRGSLLIRYERIPGPKG